MALPGFLQRRVNRFGLPPLENVTQADFSNYEDEYNQLLEKRRLFDEATKPILYNRPSRPGGPVFSLYDNPEFSSIMNREEAERLGVLQNTFISPFGDDKIEGGPIAPFGLTEDGRPLLNPVTNTTSTITTPVNTMNSFLNQTQQSTGLLNDIASVGSNTPMSTSLLGNTPTLDALQEASKVLNDRVSTSPFGNYTPNQASDYVVGPIGGIAQNRFMGNQFQMPNLFNAPYIPAAFNAASLLDPAITLPFGAFTPGAFNQGNISTITQPRAFAGNQRGPMGGRGGDRLADALSRGPALERIGGMNLSIDPVTQRIEVLDPNSLTSKVLTGVSTLQKFTPSGLLSRALSGGATDYAKQLDRIEQQFGKAVADEIAATVRESYGPGKAKPTGVLSTGLKIGDKVDLGSGIKGFINKQGKFQRGTPIGEIKTNTKKPEPKKQPKQEGPKGKGKLSDRAKAGQEGKKKGPLGKGQYGGR
jgi:hypothetical protein